MEAIERLSPRQREVFELIVRGKRNSEIADLLGIKTYTVKQHRRLMMMNLGTANASQVILLAIRAGVIARD